MATLYETLADAQGGQAMAAVFNSSISTEVSCPIRAMTGKMSPAYFIISGVISSRDIGFIPLLNNV